MPTAVRTADFRMLFNHLAALTLAAAALLASASAWADPPGRVGRIAESTGTVWMFDAEQGEWIAAKRNRPLTRGDRLSAERDARVELSIGSATVRLDAGTELEVTELDDDQVGLQLHHGSIALRLRSSESVREFAVNTREGRFEPQRVGHYRVDQEDQGSFGAVIAGAMRFEARDSALDINAGQRAEFWNDRGVTHYSWSALPNDRFGDWVAQQDRQDERDARRRPHVSPEMTGAEDLDRYGDWDSHPEYGTVWYPRRVQPGWAPYRYGHWAYVRPWGYTWVDDAPWGFAPFHYGRWISWQGRWAWAPGQYVARPVYAPALVAWIGGPNVSIGINVGGPAVGWVPLSPREVYQPQYNVTNIYVNRVNDPYRRWHPQPNQPVRTGPIMYSNQGVPGGVTVVSQDVLRVRRPINNAVVAPVDPRTIQRWQTQPLQPQQPTMRGDDRRQQAFVPPAPPSATPRVVAAPGGAVPVVPAAPGAARNTPWGQAVPGQRAPAVQAAPAVPAVRDDGERQPGRPPLRDRPAAERPPVVERAVVAPAVLVAPATATPLQREMQEQRRAPGPDNGRGEPRRGPPPQARPVPPQQAQGVQPAAQVARPAPPQAPVVTPQPVQGVRVAPQAVVLQPAVPGAPPVRVVPPEPAPQRARGPKDGDERGDERQPPGQERRREQRQQQNQ